MPTYPEQQGSNIDARQVKPPNNGPCEQAGEDHLLPRFKTTQSDIMCWTPFRGFLCYVDIVTPPRHISSPRPWSGPEMVKQIESVDAVIDSI